MLLYGRSSWFWAKFSFSVTKPWTSKRQTALKDTADIAFSHSHTMSHSPSSARSTTQHTHWLPSSQQTLWQCQPRYQEQTAGSTQPWLCCCLSKSGGMQLIVIMVLERCSGWDWSLSQWPTGFLQCFDAVGWVIWPVKIGLEMTYKVSSWTLNLCSLMTTWNWWWCYCVSLC